MTIVELETTFDELLAAVGTYDCVLTTYSPRRRVDVSARIGSAPRVIKLQG
jgi:hypothetical protein